MAHAHGITASVDPPLVRIGAPTVQTLSITVHALRIGPKQVTQAVFRQLPRRAVWDDETGALQGIPWGHVNYFWGDCPPNHLHVVWDDGDRLYRDCVYHPQRMRPEGIHRADDTLRQAQAQLVLATAHVWAIDILSQGFQLRARTWEQALPVRWAAGVQSVYDWHKAGNEASRHSADGDSVAYTLMHFMDHQKQHAIEYRKTERETCRVKDPDDLPGGRAGWTYWASDGSWSRSVDESDDAWRVRYSAEMRILADNLRVALAAEFAAYWHLDSVPQTALEAKAALEPVARALVHAQGANDTLCAHFLTTYEQIAALPQLFIAV